MKKTTKKVTSWTMAGVVALVLILGAVNFFVDDNSNTYEIEIRGKSCTITTEDNNIVSQAVENIENGEFEFDIEATMHVSCSKNSNTPEKE